MSKFQIRQGDVLVVSCDDDVYQNLTPVERDNGRVVLAYGEVTGHAHAIADKNAALYSTPSQGEGQNEISILEITGNEPVALNHEEHDTIQIPPGTYKVVRQRFYTPESIRTVAD